MIINYLNYNNNNKISNYGWVMKNRLVLADVNMRDVIHMLSELSEIDVAVEIQKGYRSELMGWSSPWLNPELRQANEEQIRWLFKSVYDFLAVFADRDPARLKDPVYAKGIYALMGFVFEAVEKIEKHTPLFKERSDVKTLSDLREYRDLHEFYASAVAFLLPPAAGLEDQWEVNWGIKSTDLTDIRGMCLKNIEEIESDKQYELLYILNENGQPFYDYEVLRHTSMLCDLNNSLLQTEGDSFFQKLDIAQDRECHHRAGYILKNSGYLLDEFFKEALKYKESLLISSLIHASMALMLSANARNLKQTSLSEKTSDSYFANFQYYLRQALSSEEYQRLIMASSDSRPFHATLYVLIHKLCTLYFTCHIDHRETAAMIRRLISEGGSDPQSSSISSYWQDLIAQDQSVRLAIEKYPAGAIHKLSEVFTKRENVKGFDPLSQTYIPEQLFTCELSKHHQVLRMPCPVEQNVIQKAVLVKEFKGFIRSCRGHVPSQKVLIINLQSRISWLEFARCIILEELVRNGDFSSTVSLVGLSKTSDFYFQEQSYRIQDDATVFIDQVKQQIDGEELCGFYFSQDVSGPIKASLNQILPMIHEMCFDGKMILTIQQRCDFIEITYLFITLVALHHSKADFITFLDKDGVDLAAAASAGWFAMSQLVTGVEMSEEDRGFFLYLLHSQALIHRERACDPIAIGRLLTALQILSESIGKNKKTMQKYLKEAGLGSFLV